MPLWVHDEGGRLRCFATSRLHLVIRPHHPPPAPYRPSPAKMPRTGRYPEQGDSYRPGGIGLSVLVVGTDRLAADLTADGLRQFVHEFDDARILVRRGDPLHMILQLPDQFLPGPRPVFLPRMIVALTTCPRISSGTPVMAHSTTAGWVIRALSTSKGPIR